MNHACLCVFSLAPLLWGCAAVPADQQGSVSVAGLEQSQAGPRLTRVEEATIRPSAAGLELQLPGEVTGSADALLASSTGGFVEAVLVETGQTVRSGQALARVDTSTAVARREQALASYQLAEAELERVRKLGDLASEAQLLAASTQARVAKASLDLAEIQVARSIITAPFAGVVSRVDLERGEVLAPGAPAIRLVKLDPVHVTVSLSDRDILVIQKGATVLVTTDAGATALQGRVLHIDPAADLDTRSFLVDVEVPNEDRTLLPGMIASVTLFREVAEGQVVIPLDWLVTRLDGVGVFVDEGGRAVWRPVETGEIVHDQVLISSGLQLGENVIMTGHRDLSQGDALLVSRLGTCCVNGRANFAGAGG